VVFPPNEQESISRLSGAKCCVLCSVLLVQLLIAAHHNVEGLAAEHDAVFQGIELCRSRDQSRILALDADFFLHADVLSLVLESAVGFVVGGRSRTAEGYCQAVAEAEASKRFLFGLLRFDGADFEDKSSIKHEEVERGRGRQWRIKGLRS
jgi:hypothetical protein